MCWKASLLLYSFSGDEGRGGKQEQMSWSLCDDYWAWDEENIKEYVALDIQSDRLASY